jgi:uncharacterized protein (DUF1015 family)
MCWEHIFMLYPDAEGAVNGLLQSFLDTHMPAIVRERVIEPEVEQAFWVVNDPQVVAAVAAALKSKGPLIIADGHHRYETALNYRDQMRAQHPDAPANAAFNYVMVTLVSMSDPGLVILPTHRLIYGYALMGGKDLREAVTPHLEVTPRWQDTMRSRQAMLLKAVAPYFEVTPMRDLGALRDALAEATPEQPRFGFYDGDYTLLTLKSLATMAELLPDRDVSFRALDVTVLHELIIEKVMGLSKESVARKENLTYLRDPASGFEAVDKGEANFLFLLNATRIEQVRTCTAAGERMPQKSTDFFPKVVSGLVALPLTGEI